MMERDMPKETLGRRSKGDKHRKVENWEINRNILVGGKGKQPIMDLGKKKKAFEEGQGERS